MEKPPEGVGVNRRTYPRVSVSCPVHLSVHLKGTEFFVEDFSSAGTVLDISRKGLLAEVDRLLSVGTVCVLSLAGADQFVRPANLRGRVCRSVIGGSGWRIGIEFESLIELSPGVMSADRLPQMQLG